MTTEKFSLKWNDFQQNIGSSFAELRNNLDFSDVTLVCEDNQQFEAHRIILSACSPFFRNVLKKNKHSHPMIYMRGLKTKDIVSVVDFIYHGETNIYQEDLDGFLTLAEELQLKGLARSQNNDTSDVAETLLMSQRLEDKKVGVEEVKPFQYPLPINDSKMVDYSRRQPFLKESESRVVVLSNGENALVDANMEDVKGQINSMLEKTGGEGGNFWKCTVCGKTSNYKQTIERHIETHIEGISYPCNQCGAIKRSSSAINMHVSRYHK